MPIPSNWSEDLRRYVQSWKASPASEEYIGDRPFPNFVVTDAAQSWHDWLVWVNELTGSWCFRGQREASWFLDTSLDRGVHVVYSGHDDQSGYHFSGHFKLDRKTEQGELLLKFKQQAHHHFSQLPAADDLASWLALMQHHGVPTRLLDWTASPHVALYFAEAEEPREHSDPCSAVWAIDRDWLRAKADELLGPAILPVTQADAVSRTEGANRLLGQAEKSLIVEIAPAMMSARMEAQQGILLCKLRHEATFNQMLMRMMTHPDVEERPVIRKLEVARQLRMDSLYRLREMNIHSASLFPGIDGFGQMLKHDLEIKAWMAGQGASRV